MTFPTGVVEIRKCSDEELKTMLDEAREKRLKPSRGMFAYDFITVSSAWELTSVSALLTWGRS